jgi:hypothetical protein
MCKSLKISLFAALAVMVFVLPAQADRRAGMNGNVLIEDYNDVFTFPQRAGNAMNVNKVRLNHRGGNNTSATLGVKKGNGGWGVGVNALSQPGDPLAAGATATILEAVYSGGAWGVGLSLGKGEATVDGEGNTALDLGLIFGYDIKGTAETSLGIGFKTSEDGAKTKTTDINAGINARGYKGKLGWTFNFGFQSETVAPDMGDEVKNGALTIEAGAGPVYKVNGGKGIVALHITGGFASLTQGDDSTMQIAVPGMNLAFETALNDWVHFRAGAGYKFVMTTVSPDMGDEAKLNHADGTMAGMAFNAAPTGAMGLSATWGKMNFDVALNRDFITNGPYLLTGGTTANWAGSVAGTYSF